MNAFRPLRATSLIALVAASAFLVGCASTGSSMAARSPANKLQRDLDYMAAVESGARSKGVRVVWVNPPYERGKRYTR